MKKFVIVAIGFCIVLSFHQLSAENNRPDQFDHLSPMPGAKMVSCETGIIIRSKNILDPGISISGKYLLVTGNKSGTHSVRAVLSDDNRTMVFQPDEPFALNENVSVSFREGIRTSSGETLQPFTFSFTTLSQKISFEPQLETMNDVPHNNVSRLKPQSGISRTIRALTDTLPPDFPPITFTTYKPVPLGQIFIDNDESTSSIGYYLVDVATSGKVLGYKRTNNYAYDFKRQPNGLLSYYDRNFLDFIVMDSLYTVINTYRAIGYFTDVHDFQMLANGHVLIMGDDPESVNMDTVVPGGNPNAVVDGIIIQELDQSKNLVFQWRSWDHYKITDAIGVDFTANTIDYCHGNSLDLDYDGNILFSTRNMSEITKIDRNTGDIIWRWGGKNNQFTFLGDTLQFTYQHAARLIQNGNYMLFDNGDLHNPPFSRAVEYQLDQTQKTATTIWQYRNTPDLYGYSTGYAQRLDDGNTLIDWGTTNPNTSLVAPDSTKIFDLTFPEGMYTYRAYMYPYTPPVLSVSPSGESVSLNPGSAQRESLKVVNFDTSVSHYTISAHQPWLVLSSSTDSVPPSDSVFFDFTVNAAGLTSWNVYKDTITISGYDTLHSAIHVPVTLNTLGTRILVKPTNLSVEIDSGLVAHDTVKIFNIGLLPLIWRITDTSSNSWLTFSSTPDTLAPGDSIFEDILFNATTQPHGTFHTLLTIFNNDSSTGNVMIPVTFNVLELWTIQTPISAGWNMLSLPVLPFNESKFSVFPPAISNAFKYDNSYVISNNLKTGIGYWLKFDSSQTIPITGGILTSDSIAMNSGWNMIGSISTPISIFSIASIPPGIQTSDFFTYKGHYVISDSIAPGAAYWVKVSQDGTFILSSGSSASPKNRIKIVQTAERPPLPPNASSTTAGEIPKEYALDPAYPSPFNPTTTIRYQLPFESKVSLKVYNLLGQVVGTLQDGIEDAGFKSVVWDASKFSSGVYFYRLVTVNIADPSETFMQVQKMVLVK